MKDLSGTHNEADEASVRDPLDYASLGERSVCAVLLNVAHALCRDGHKDSLSELCYENTALVEVCLAAHLAGWVELRSTRTVRVPSAYLSCLSCYCAFACHSSCMLA